MKKKLQGVKTADLESQDHVKQGKNSHAAAKLKHDLFSHRVLGL